MNLDLLALNSYLNARLPGADLCPQILPACGKLALYLLNPDFDDSCIPFEIKEQISDEPPYWIFAWASGYALAEKILENEISVKDKTIIDFGAGSGIVAIAARLAGAKNAIACEVDPVAKSVIARNAELNGVPIQQISNLGELKDRPDLILAADVLYERAHLGFLDLFLQYAPSSIVADSRQKQLSHTAFRYIATHWTTSFPDFAEAQEFNEVKFYQAG